MEFFIGSSKKNFLKKYLATGKTDAKGKPVFASETALEKRKRRILPFAIPVAMATWLVMLTNAVGVIKGGQLGPERQPVQGLQSEQAATMPAAVEHSPE